MSRDNRNNYEFLTAVCLAYAGKRVSSQLEHALSAVRSPRRVPSLSALIALEYLDSRDEVVAQSDLGAILPIRRVAITEVVNNFCAKGLATRTVDPSHGKFRRLEITALGKEMLPIARQAAHESAAEMFENFEPDKARQLGGLASEFLSDQGRHIWLPEY